MNGHVTLLKINKRNFLFSLCFSPLVEDSSDISFLQSLAKQFMYPRELPLMIHSRGGQVGGSYTKQAETGARIQPCVYL